MPSQTAASIGHEMRVYLPSDIEIWGSSALDGQSPASLAYICSWNCQRELSTMSPIIKPEPLTVWLEVRLCPPRQKSEYRSQTTTLLVDPHCTF